MEMTNWFTFKRVGRQRRGSVQIGHRKLSGTDHWRQNHHGSFVLTQATQWIVREASKLSLSTFKSSTNLLGCGAAIGRLAVH